MHIFTLYAIYTMHFFILHAIYTTSLLSKLCHHMLEPTCIVFSNHWVEGWVSHGAGMDVVKRRKIMVLQRIEP